MSKLEIGVTIIQWVSHTECVTDLRLVEVGRHIHGFWWWVVFEVRHTLENLINWQEWYTIQLTAEESLFSLTNPSLRMFMSQV